MRNADVTESKTSQIINCKNPGSCAVIAVEDDPLLAMVIEIDLTSAGIHFCAASDGFQALDLIKSHHPKVLLLDVSIPGMSGFELIEVLNRTRRLVTSAACMSLFTPRTIFQRPRERAYNSAKRCFLQKRK